MVVSGGCISGGFLDMVMPEGECVGFGDFGSSQVLYEN